MTDLPTSRIDLKAVLTASSPTVAMADHTEGMSYLESVPRESIENTLTSIRKYAGAD